MVTQDQLQAIRGIVEALPEHQRTLENWTATTTPQWAEGDRPRAKYLAALAGYPTDDHCTSCDPDVLFGLLQTLKKADQVPSTEPTAR